MLLKEKGFTLVELLAIIVVLGIILVIALPNVFKVIEKTKKETISVDAAHIAKYLETNRVKGIDPLTFTKSDLDNIGVNSNKYDGFGVSLVNNKVVVTLTQGKYIGENKLDTKVYGVYFDGTSSTGVRTDDAVGLTYTVNTNTITSAFDNAEIYGEMIEETDSYGNVFVKIPKFWIKKTVVGDTWKYQISKTRQDSDYYLPSCFYDEASGKILPYVLVGKYNASLNVDKLESKSGKLPLVSKTIAQFRTYARANNVGTNQGYQILDIHTVDLLQVLFYIEFATLDSQSIMQGFTTGQYNAAHTISSVSGTTITLPVGVASNYRVGQTIDIGTSLGGRQIATNLRVKTILGNDITYETVSGISNIGGTIATSQIVYNVGYLTGTTNSVSTVSGSPTSNSDGKYAMKYRGIENLYGNIWQFVDGVNIKDNQAYVAVDASLYQSDIFSGAYTQLGYINANTNNSVLKMGYDNNNPFMQLPISVGAYASGFYKDSYFQNTGNRIALVGGRWRNVDYDAGVSSWNLSNASEYNYLVTGSRLVKIPL